MNAQQQDKEQRLAIFRRLVLEVGSPAEYSRATGRPLQHVSRYNLGKSSIPAWKLIAEDAGILGYSIEIGNATIKKIVPDNQ